MSISEKFSIVVGHIDEFQDLKKFAEAQYILITDLTKENTTLKAKIENLERLLSQSTPLINGPEDKEELGGEEAIICRDQLIFLNMTSKSRELTLEETRKVDIYSKILASFRLNPKKAKAEYSQLKLADILSIAEGDNGNGQATE